MIGKLAVLVCLCVHTPVRLGQEMKAYNTQIDLPVVMFMSNSISHKLLINALTVQGHDMAHAGRVGILLLLLLLSAVYGAANPRLEFSHIGMEEGMSRATVFDITQDKQGFMWIATNDGLNRFDGYEFKIYRNNSVDKHSIGSDVIKTVVCDRQGRLWIGTDKTLTYYDADYDRFKNFHIGEKTPVDHILPLDKGRLLICSEGRLWMFDTNSGQCSRLSSYQNITAICKHGSDVLLGNSEGIFLYAIKSRKVTPIMTHELQGRKIQTMIARGDRLWVATEGGGLYLIDLKTRSLKRYTKANSMLCSDYVRSLAFDSNRQLWIGTVEGLNIMDRYDAMTAHRSNTLDPGSLSQASVRCIYPDRQGGMWIGTYFGGLNYYHPVKNKFSNIRTIPGQNSLNNNVIGCIVEDSRHNLWIGTNGGINIYQATRKRYEHVTTENGLLSNDIKAIYTDPATGVAYIGSQLGGLGIMRPGSQRVETILSSDEVADANSIYAILPDRRGGGLLLGTLTGLKHYDKQTRQISSIPLLSGRLTAEQKKTRVIYRDDRHRLWVGTEGGLLIYSRQGKKLRQLFPSKKAHALARAFILCMAPSKDGHIWIGTRQGVFKVNPKTWTTHRYTVVNGLPSNIVYGMLQDNADNIWFSTGYGLCRLHAGSEEVRSYTYEDGIQNNRFTPQAFCKTSDGRMLFGGVNGITMFSPDLLSDNPYTPKAIITELRLFNNVVYPEDDTGILSRQIAYTRRIELSHSQSMFSLSFVVPNYIAGQHNTFAYMLEGYDDKWHLTNKNRTVSYSRLPHGKYIFKVKTANNDGKWDKTPTTLEIVVLPVWYKTWWARTLFLLLIVGLALLVFRYVLSRKIDKMQLAQERREKQRIQEVNEMKQRFFIDVSHELRTPLTLICSPLQELEDRTDDPWSQKQLTIIGRNVNKLLYLVNQLMDYRRAELGVFKLQVAHVNLHEIVEKVFSLFDKLAVKNKIDYKLTSTLQGKEVLCDPAYIETILNNLLSNAFKYTHVGQRIDVRIGQEDDKFGKRRTFLQVSDTGEGIPEDLQDRVFDRFFQVNSMHTGSGIGLSLVKRLVTMHHGEITLDSSPGKGATFSVWLPDDQGAYQPGEIAEDNKVKPYAVSSPNVDIFEAGVEPEDAELSEEAPAAGSATLLIVEDNTDIRRYLVDALCDQYHVVEASNGKEAMEKLDAETISLVLTDVMMPEMDGFELCKRIKRHIQTCHIPVIILSAKVETREQLDGLLIGADDYITKPFSISILKAKIRNTLRIREAAIAHYTQTQQVVPKEITNNKMDEDLLTQAVNVVNKNISNSDFSTEMFAREMLMSRSNLHIKLKALTGESANDFVKRIRFNKACSLIKEGKLSISEISYRVGFSSPSYFATSFKKRFGCMPSEYRDKTD